MHSHHDQATLQGDANPNICCGRVNLALAVCNTWSCTFRRALLKKHHTMPVIGQEQLEDAGVRGSVQLRQEDDQRLGSQPEERCGRQLHRHFPFSAFLVSNVY